jgi:hypothetical protein
MRSGLYRVVGQRNYRGHEHGTVFEARLDPGAELRAVSRGDIQLLKRTTPSLQPGSYTLPRGWLNERKEV